MCLSCGKNLFAKQGKVAYKNDSHPTLQNGEPHALGMPFFYIFISAWAEQLIISNLLV